MTGYLVEEGNVNGMANTYWN